MESSSASPPWTPPTWHRLTAVDPLTNNNTEPCLTLDALPPDILARIIQHLSLADIHNLETTSKGYHAAVQEERVWYAVCGRYPTSIRKWLPPFVSPPAETAINPPETYRQLYHMLREVENLRGAWRVVGEGPISALVSFDWTATSMTGLKLDFTAIDAGPDKIPYTSFCPANGLNASFDWTDDNNVTIKDLKSMLRRSPSYQAAEDIAAVGYGTPCTSSSALGSSPVGSFEHEWVRFMSANVALGGSRSKSRRRFSRGVAAAPPIPVMHHLRRVVQPIPTSRHPLAGLWIADYGEGGLQVLRTSYDFSGRRASIIAEKVTGDEDIPAGATSWSAHAAALPVPWPAEDAELVEDWQQARWEEAAAADGLAGILLEEDDDDSMGAGGSNGSDGDVPRHSQHLGSQVVEVHVGRGQAEAGEWVEGRLWVHADGSLSFHWMNTDAIARMRRIDKELPKLARA